MTPGRNVGKWQKQPVEQATQQVVLVIPDRRHRMKMKEGGLFPYKTSGGSMDNKYSILRSRPNHLCAREVLWLVLSSLDD